jgi:hypothetical protein
VLMIEVVGGQCGGLAVCLRLRNADWKSRHIHVSRMAVNSISGVIMPWRAYQSCVTG